MKPLTDRHSMTIDHKTGISEKIREISRKSSLTAPHEGGRRFEPGRSHRNKLFCPSVMPGPFSCFWRWVPPGATRQVDEMRVGSILKKSGRFLVRGDRVVGTTFRWTSYLFFALGVPWLLNQPVTLPLWALVIGTAGVSWLSWVVSRAWTESDGAELQIAEELEPDLNYGMFRLRVRNTGFRAVEPTATADCFDNHGQRIGPAFPVNLQWSHNQQRIPAHGGEATLGVAYTRTTTGSSGIFWVAGENAVTLNTDIKSRRFVFLTIAIRSNHQSIPIQRHFRLEPDEKMPLGISVTRLSKLAFGNGLDEVAATDSPRSVSSALS